MRLKTWGEWQKFTVSPLRCYTFVIMVKVTLNTEVVGRLLAERCLSQRDFAKLVGVSSGYVSQLLSGTRHPSPALRKRLLRVFRTAGFDEVFTVLNKDRREG